MPSAKKRARLSFVDTIADVVTCNTDDEDGDCDTIIPDSDNDCISDTESFIVPDDASDSDDANFVNDLEEFDVNQNINANQVLVSV